MNEGVSEDIFRALAWDDISGQELELSKAYEVRAEEMAFIKGIFL